MRKFIAMMAGLGLAATAVAQWDETVNGGGDAGDLPATAQVVTGAGPLGFITGGWLASDVDMYQILICDEANFSATTVGGTTADTQLWLFDANGAGVTFNDDAGSSFQSTITSLFVNSNGLYYLAISKYNRDAVNSANQLIWNNSPFGIERAPDGPGAGNPIVTGWTGTTSTGGTYRITLTGACFVPEPASALLLSLGALALRRRR